MGDKSCGFLQLGQLYPEAMRSLKRIDSNVAYVLPSKDGSVEVNGKINCV